MSNKSVATFAVILFVFAAAFFAGAKVERNHPSNHSININDAIVSAPAEIDGYECSFENLVDDQFKMLKHSMLIIYFENGWATVSWNSWGNLTLEITPTNQLDSSIQLLLPDRPKATLTFEEDVNLEVVNCYGEVFFRTVSVEEEEK